jgi:hypothetical protein
MKKFLLGLLAGALAAAACSEPQADEPTLIDPDGNLLVPRTVTGAVSVQGTIFSLPEPTRVWVPQGSASIWWPEE